MMVRGKYHRQIDRAVQLIQRVPTHLGHGCPSVFGRGERRATASRLRCNGFIHVAMFDFFL